MSVPAQSIDPPLEICWEEVSRAHLRRDGILSDVVVALEAWREQVQSFRNLLIIP